MMLLIAISPRLKFAVLPLHLLNQRCFPLRIDEFDGFHFPLFLIIREGFLTIHFHMNSSPTKLGQNRPKQTLNQNSVTPSKRSMYCYMSLPDPIRNGLTRQTISSSFTPMKRNIKGGLKGCGNIGVKELYKR